MKHKHAKTIVPINNLIAQRWSSRAFDPQKAISEDKLLALFEAARWAPSCFDEQPWYYLALDRYRDEPTWSKVHVCLDEWNRNWAKNAPLIIIATAKTNFDFNGEINPWAQYDTGAATENMTLQAADMGLMSRQMGGFNAELTRETFDIPKTHDILSIVAFGYPGPTEHLSEKHEAAEKAGRDRNALSKHFFISDWGHDADE